MTPYYVDDSVTLYLGDCREVLPTLAPESVALLLTDPPYFNVKDEDWDRQWKQAGAFLDWLGGVLDDVQPALLPSASAWVFAAPALATAVERVVAERFRVLNNVRWVKEQGWHQKAEIEAQRRFLTPWEAIVFAEQFADAYASADYEAHKAAFLPTGRYLEAQRLAVGLSRADVAAALVAAGVHRSIESATANISLWEIGVSMISPRGHAAWSSVVPTKGYEDICRDYEDSRRGHLASRQDIEHLRRPFKLDARGPVSDVWNFGTVAPYAGKHPCEKPLPMLRHMLGVSSRPGDLVLDCFAGSGSTLLAARDMGRRAIGIEQDERWCEFTAARLSQGALFDVGGAA